jgi:hypothetical protein
LTKVIVAAQNMRVSDINIEQIQKIIKTVRNIELIVELESNRR